MGPRDYLQKFWPYFAIAGMLVALLGASVFVVATLPPRTIVMTTGVEGGAYHKLGVRYREILGQAGVELRLLTSAGALQNLQRLRDPRSGVDVGFVQGGTTTQKESPGLESLGTVSYEPLWLFTRIRGSRAEELSGRRISIGPEGSGTRDLVLKLLEKNKVVAELLGFTPDVAAEKLIAGDIDAAFIVSPWDSPAVQRLITAEGIELRGFPRADAYVQLFPFLTKLVLQEGVGDLATNRPPSDVLLVAPKASLAVRADLHPAIQYLLLDAAADIHSGPGIFRKDGQFPAAESGDVPLSDEAQRFYKRGQPFLHNYLPFWIAVLTERAIVVLIPFAVLLYPFIKLLPRTYDWIMRSKIIPLCDELRSVEREMEAGGPGLDAAAIAVRLDQLDQRANHLRLPAAYASTIYTLRSYIDLLRERLAIDRPGKPH
jgi:NMT1-like family